MDIRNKKLSNDDFFAQRNEVLSQWKTGSEVNFEEAVEYQKSIAPEKKFGNELAKAVENIVRQILGTQIAQRANAKHGGQIDGKHDDRGVSLGEWHEWFSRETRRRRRLCALPAPSFGKRPNATGAARPRMPGGQGLWGAATCLCHQKQERI